MDKYTEVTSTSWFGRMGKAFTGVLFGLLCIVAGIVLLFWNEGRTVEQRKALNEGAASVRGISPDTVDPANQGALVHLTGMATTDEILTDPDFGIQVQAVRLRRDVEMYQWKESSESRTEKKLGGGEETVTTYTYSKTWSSSRIDSSSFKKPEGHENPADMPLREESYTAADVRLGAFTLPQSLVNSMGGWQPLRVEDPQPRLPDYLTRNLQRTTDGFYIGESPGSPRIGDLRVSFQVVLPAVVSLYAQQVGDSFGPFPTKAGASLLRLDMGAHSAAEMFAQAHSENTALMWILRLVGLVLLVAGFAMVLKPISVVLDVIPMLGNVASMGIFLVSLLLGASIGLLVIAVAWLFYRPLLGVGLIVASVALLFGLRKLRAKASTEPAMAGAGAMPPPPPPPPAR